MDFNNEFCVNEGAFWHTNMDLYYGFQPGEVVEVQHEINKYWLATIKYSYKHLILLKWIGNYGEFWIDTSSASTSSSSVQKNNNTFSNSGNSNFHDYNITKIDENNCFKNSNRLFPLGYHLKSQLESQFILEKPTKFLIKPTRYNPIDDPYSNIETIDDLLAFDRQLETGNDVVVETTDEDIKIATTALVTLNQPIDLITNSSAKLVAECETKINYRQEDEDELEAALQNLNEIDSGMELNQGDDGSLSNDNSYEKISIRSDEKATPINLKSTDRVGHCYNTNKYDNDNAVGRKIENLQTTNEYSSSLEQEANLSEGQETIKAKDNLNADNTTIINTEGLVSGKDKLEVEYEKHVKLCKSLQESAICDGRYMGIEENSDKIYYLKPQRIFDIGGANQEKVFLPGTLLEVCHTIDDDLGGLELCHWFAIVLKNIGGRLTLRWFLCDEPKFKQGRLDLKTCKSKFVNDDIDDEYEDDESAITSQDVQQLLAPIIPIKDITFSMHFCNPCIHTIQHSRKIPSNSKQIKRPYKMPEKMVQFFIKNAEIYLDETQKVESILSKQIEFALEFTRIEADLDRPVIDHILSTIRWKMPQYVEIIYAPSDVESRREVLISTPKTTKLLKGYIRRELESGVYEIVSEALASDPSSAKHDVVKFIYPFDSSYTVLPLSWADNNQDCLSIHPSRTTTPIPAAPISSVEISKTPVDSSIPATSQKETNLPIVMEEVEEDMEPNENNELLRDKEQNTITTVIDSVIDKIASENDEIETKAGNQKLVNPYTLMCEIVKISQTPKNGEFCGLGLNDKLDPNYWSLLNRYNELNEVRFNCEINNNLMDCVRKKFRVMDQLEVVHPSSNVTICTGRIRKIVYPLLWIQISADSYTLLPFNSTNIYPTHWCEYNNHQLISLLPPRKRINQQTLSQLEKKRKRTKTTNNGDQESSGIELEINEQRAIYEREHFDLGALTDKQLDIDYILNEKSMYIRIYFNHKCFTGPSLSKGKICSLPQYVGPGPLRLVMEEVVTKVISVAYVPPRILNDLSSKSFEDLLIARNLNNTAPMEFKAKYQKRVHREDIPVCLDPNDVALYCECICEHLKCCYNLFGPNLYDGDDCPGHCRALTKSNKFMKRATYYREKARLGEFTNNDTNGTNNNNNKKSTQNNSAGGGGTGKSSRARYAGRDSSESTSSSVSRSEQVNSRASSAVVEEVVARDSATPTQPAIAEPIEVNCKPIESCSPVPITVVTISAETTAPEDEKIHENEINLITPEPPKVAPSKATEKIEKILSETIMMPTNKANISTSKPPIKWPNDSEFKVLDSHDLKPHKWTIEDVASLLKWCCLSSFISYMVSERVDGEALLLLDRASIKEHFQQQPKVVYSPEEVGKLCRFVEYIKTRAGVET